jgi:hypothetical protein
MADERPESPNEDAPSLELPSLRSALRRGRTRKPKAAQPDAAAEPPVTVDGESPAEPVEPVEPVEPIEPVEPVTPTDPDLPVPPIEPEPGPPITPGPIGLPETQPEVDPTAVLPATAAMDDEPGTRRSLRARFDLHLPGPLVALLTGAIVGLALVGLTSGGLTLCSSMRGTSSCGKPGILLLLVITVAMVFLGSLLLRVAGVDPHGSTSFLGVGLLVVVILVALLPVIFHWWMVIVVPVVAMLTYAASWWLTTTYVEPGERVR